MEIIYHDPMKKNNYIHRVIENKIKEWLKQFSSVALTGPRQSGKSTTLKKIFSSYKYLSLEDPSIRESILTEPKLFLESLPENVIFDEIQYIPELLIYIKMMIDEKRNKKGRYLITGSQQFSLMKNMSETLAGRVGLLNLLPLSYQEIRDKDKKRLNSRKLFFNTCLSGSYPELITHPHYNKKAWYNAYVQTYIERDVKSIYNIGNLRDFHNFMKLLSARCSQQLNMNNLSLDLGVAVNTIKNWISILEASYIIFLLNPYYANIGKRITKSPKIYFIDSGLVNYFLRIQNEKELLQNPLLGALFENYCIQEILKCFHNHGIEPALYYLRTKTGHEIDLLKETKKGLLPIEIKFSKSPNKQMIQSMEYFFSSQIKGLSLMKGYIVSLADTDLILSKNVTFCNIHSFLDKLGEWI